MATLKQVLIAVAATAVGVLASPPPVNATATSVVDAPEPAVTAISEPLEGKALEDFLAGWPYTPEGSVDITNTTLATELIKFREAHDNGTALAKRGGPCGQHDCPDFFAAFDLYEQHWVIPVYNSYLDYWVYYGRWNDCGKCGMVQTNKNGCFDFTSCGRKQTICVDTSKSRAHRIWKDNGHKSCYSLKFEFLGGCGSNVASRIIHPLQEIACTW